MQLRPTTLDINDETPFANDKLNRQPITDFLIDIINSLEGGCVLALDAPWGTGKTTMIRMLMSELKKREIGTVCFNAWEVDYVTDPLIPMVSALESLVPKSAKLAESFKDNFETLKKVTTKIGSRVAVNVIKHATMGIIDDTILTSSQEDLREHFSDDLVAAYQNHKKQSIEFKNCLRAVVDSHQRKQPQTPLVFFIDELDRCRPTFTIELLERVKHVFNIDHIVFVLSIDKTQLEHAIRAVYGTNIDAANYLRRFIDLDYKLPTKVGKDFTESLLTRFNLLSIFSHRPNSTVEIQSFIKTFTFVFSVFELTLREREQCVARIAVVLSKTASNQSISPILVSFLIVLRLKMPDVYQRYVDGDFGPNEVIEKLRELKNFEDFLSRNESVYIEALLIKADIPEQRFEKNVADLDTKLKNEKANTSSRFSRLKSALNSVTLEGDIDLKSIHKRIELSGNLDA